VHARAHGERVPLRHRRRPADRDPRALRQVAHHRVRDRPAGVVEIAVDAVGTVAGDGLRHILALVVDGRVEAEFLQALAFLLRSARDPDGATALGRARSGPRPTPPPLPPRTPRPCRRPSRRSFRSGRNSGRPVQPENAQRVGPGQVGFRDPARDRVAVDQRMGLPAQEPLDHVALGETGWRDARTSPTAKERIGSPRATGGE
jgi:hypothetical protein